MHSRFGSSEHLLVSPVESDSAHLRPHIFVYEDELTAHRSNSRIREVGNKRRCCIRFELLPCVCEDQDLAFSRFYSRIERRSFSFVILSNENKIGVERKEAGYDLFCSICRAIGDNYHFDKLGGIIELE